MEEINDYRNVIIGSSPRTGGMWTYNIIREIFLQLNKKIIPLDVPNNDNEMMHYHFKNLVSKEDFISIIKIHKLVKKKYTNKTKIIINIRDPRDAVMSYMRFMKFKNFSFEQAISFIQGSINRVYHYRKIIDKENLLEIDFKDVENNPKKIFLQLENFFKLSIDKTLVNKIIKKFSKKEIFKLIKQKEKIIKKISKDKKKIEEKNLVVFHKKIVRIFDEKTGFQTGHVSNYKEGDWKKYFSSNEVFTINNKFEEWLKSNNFLI